MKCLPVLLGLLTASPNGLTVVERPAPCRAEVRMDRGFPSLWVNEKPEVPFAFLMHVGDFDKHYSQMASAGVRVFTMSGAIGLTPQGFDPAACDPPFLQILRHQPDALIFPRVDITAPSWWLEAHPDDRVVFDDGSTGPQSMFSKAWRHDACRWIEQYARHIRTSPYADHVIGIHICTGYTGEWQSWGLWDDKRGDFSPVAAQAWRDFLTRKYGTDQALSEAWGKIVALSSAEIPSRERREAVNGFLRRSPLFQDVADFYDFYWRGTAASLQEVAAAAKQGGGRDWLVGVFYGYAIQYGGKMQESQHLGMRDVMDCPDIDFFCSPAMYTLRGPGGTSTFMSFTDSIRLRGKLWWDEADNRTHLVRNDPYSPAADLFESLAVLKREFAHAWSRHAGIWWFDMQGGWYDDPVILDLFRAMRVWTETHDARWEPDTQVAVFIDDKSSYRLRPEEPFLHQAVTEFMSQMPRLGAPYHTYLLTDIVRTPPYLLYVFPLAFDLTSEEREAIHALKRRSATLLFFGPAGVGAYIDGRTRHDENLAADMLGFLPKGEEPRTLNSGEARIVWWPRACPSMAELRDIALEAGVHVYHGEDDACYIGNGLIALHASENGPGVKTVRFPEALTYTELFCENPLSGSGRQISFELKPKETRCFAVRSVR